jgi:Ca2+-binding RTX toxin-like protein
MLRPRTLLAALTATVLASAGLVTAGATPAAAIDLCPDDVQGQVINGDSGPNVIYGTDGPDVIHGHGGADTIYGLGGADTIYGDAGDDVIYGGLCDDGLSGDRGDDHLYGGDGNDLIAGGGGTDTADGGAGTNWCEAENQGDTIYGQIEYFWINPIGYPYFEGPNCGDPPLL